MIKVGCSGYPTSQAKYFGQFGVVELANLSNRFPRKTTIKKWREKAPYQFEFIPYVSRKIESFHDSLSNRESFKQSIETADILSSKIMIFSLPRSMSPQADNVMRIQKFFKTYPSTNRLYIWNVPFSWPPSLVERLSRACNIIPSINPLFQKPYLNFPIQYFRVSTKKRLRSEIELTKNELANIKNLCTPHKLNYVIFNSGPASYKHALDFLDLI